MTQPSDTPDTPAYDPETLLAFLRGDLTEGTDEYERIADLVVTDPVWRAHADSARDLDLERLAARRDGEDLEAWAGTFDPDAPATAEEQDFCWSAARAGPAYFRSWASWPADRRRQWTAFLQSDHPGAVYCRRLRRQAFAELARLDAGIHDQPLLRDWLLADYYQPAMDRLTKLLRHQSVTYGRVFSAKPLAAGTEALTVHQERWQSPDGRHTAILTFDPANPGTVVNVRFEDAAARRPAADLAGRPAFLRGVSATIDKSGAAAFPLADLVKAEEAGQPYRLAVGSPEAIWPRS
jgi:hypothetical protein